jgi:hypothetical protein
VSVFKVADYLSTCSTRSRAQTLYPAIRDFADSEHGATIVISFEDTALVTPSFLDETVTKLVQDRQVCVDVIGVPPFARRSFATSVQQTRPDVVHRSRADGFSLAPA